MAEGGHRGPPALTRRAQYVVGARAGVVEEHLVGAAVAEHGPDGPHRDTGLVERDEHVRQAGVFHTARPVRTIAKIQSAWWAKVVQIFCR